MGNILLDITHHRRDFLNEKDNMMNKYDDKKSRDSQRDNVKSTKDRNKFEKLNTASMFYKE